MHRVKLNEFLSLRRELFGDIHKSLKIVVLISYADLDLKKVHLDVFT